MNPRRDDNIIQEKIRMLLANPPEYKFSDERRRELISLIYRIEDEKRRIVEFVPFKVPFRIPQPVYAAVGTVLLVFFGIFYMFTPLYPVVEGVKGTVKVYRANKNQWMLVQDSKVRLYKGDIVKTFEGARADITRSRDYHIRIKQDSEIRLAQTGRRVLSGNIKYNLSKGKAFNYYKKQKQGRKFEVETPEAMATVLGTDFMVQVMPDMNKTWVGVLDGVVKVTTRGLPDLEKLKGASVLVEAGEKTVVREGMAPTKPRRLIENELLELEELYRIGTKPQVALLISTGKSRVRELLSGTPLYISSERPGVLPEKIEAIAHKFSQAVRERSKEKHLENIKEFEEIVNKYPNPKYDVQLLLFIASYYEYLDEHEKSIATFQKVIDNYPSSNLLSIAQCAIGIIYEEKLHDIEKAKVAYEKVLANYPRSAEVYEAEEGLKRIEKGR